MQQFVWPFWTQAYLVLDYVTAIVGQILQSGFAHLQKVALLAVVNLNGTS